MPIYVPGKRDPRHKNRIIIAKRMIVTGLSLTSMVDMFTILVVFLLQNYSSTGEILNIPKDVHLPKASSVKELKPAHVVTVTTDSIVLDNNTIADLAQVKAQKDWMIPSLRESLVAALQQDEINYKKALSDRVKEAIPLGVKKEVPAQESLKKITVQADKEMDFLTIKKVMFTVTEAGAEEINFAVMKKVEENAVQAN
ncbi:MAG: biopolymer transporter ExbD [Oligoflexia bacterium]|nr:biopolymer transporter ExbD [Oligoflexia bacterium]